MRDKRQPSAITVTPLDLSGLETAAAEYLTKHREVDGLSAVTKVTTEKWAIVDTKFGVYALCTEGVGPDHPITEDKPLVVEFWIREYADTEQDFISMMPSCSQSLDADDLRKLATGDPVPLHDWIRSFGARLETNYTGWRRLLETAAITA